MRTEDILCKARAATGLSDPGDPAVLDALERLVEASNEEANLSAVGAQRWEANLVGILSNRLRIVAHLEKHPELLARPVEKPMFVFGLPRTGTTLAINLLSAGILLADKLGHPVDFPGFSRAKQGAVEYFRSECAAF